MSESLKTARSDSAKTFLRCIVNQKHSHVPYGIAFITFVATAMKFLSTAFSRLFALFYFFLNSWKLPHGLLFTHLVSPVFVFNHLRAGQWRPYAMMMAPLLAYSIVHLTQGANPQSLLISTCMAVSTFAVAFAMQQWLSQATEAEQLFTQFNKANALMAVLALLFYFTPLRTELWYLEKFTAGISHFPRLKLFTYEASYYAFISAPLFIFFTLRLFLSPASKNLTFWLFSAVPMALSFSFGVLASIAFALLPLLLFSSSKSTRKHTALVAIGFIVIVAIAYSLFPDFAVFRRLVNMFNGADGSMVIRLGYAYQVAWQIASEYNLVFGVGFGQIKEVMPAIAEKFYDYSGPLETVRIPNSVAETLAMFGLSGLALRFGLQIWFFFKCRVFQNNFQLAMFIFMFTYQFSGSFVVNIVEYTAWLLAFTPLFPQFNKNQPG